MDKQKRFEKILKDIKSIKIQGARNIAKSALNAYYLIPNNASIKKLVSIRPTEPMLQKVLDLTKNQTQKEILEHFEQAQERINQIVFNLIENKDILFTHCHSTNVVSSLIYSKKKGKNFEVFNTETRPLFQGRKTARDLKKAHIKVTHFVDSAISFALEKEDKKDKIYVKKIFLGSDALLKKGIINKIGSKLIAEIAFNNNIPVYIVADSWKFSKKNIPIENRKLKEVWDKAPKNIKIKNPTFEFVPKKYITAIITEKGFSKYDSFVNQMLKEK
jgi:translation initiation factor 2B subunit (eIF-2B alpha/beta/delta family)